MLDAMSYNGSFEMDEQRVTARKRGPSAAFSDSDARGIKPNRDEMEMYRMGKKPVLKRNFNFVSLLGFSCAVLITWEAILVTYLQSFYNGGPGGVVFGFLLVWSGTLSTFAVISELASMAPMSGGQYYWVYLLAPRSCSKILSYLTGWITFAGWQAFTASSGYLTGTLIQSLIVFNHPDYAPKPWQGMLLYWAVTFVALVVNTIASQALTRLEGGVLILHVFGFVSILIPLVYLGPHGSASMYTTFLNEGGWSSQGLSFFVGLSGSTFTMIGADSTVHLAEEVNNASLVVPRAIMTGLFVNGLLGFSMLLTFIICIEDMDKMLASQKTLAYPFIEVFSQATRSAAGTTIMACIVVVMGLSATVGCLAAASRMQWSFARDRGLPYWETLIKLHPRTSTPIYSVALTTVISLALSLVTLSASIAFSDLVSLTVCGLYSSYLLCCALLLWRRCKGDIRLQGDLTEPLRPTILVWGRWRIPGLLGIVNNIIACVFLLVIWFFSFWPPAAPVESAAAMNFMVVLFSGVLIFSLVWYFFRARKYYEGPVIEI